MLTLRACQLGVMSSWSASEQAFLFGTLLLAGMTGQGFRPVAAQGVAGAIIEGTVVSPAGVSVGGAVLTLIESTTGAFRQTTSSAPGAYHKIVPDASRWRVQLGARYDF